MKKGYVTSHSVFLTVLSQFGTFADGISVSVGSLLCFQKTVSVKILMFLGL